MYNLTINSNSSTEELLDIIDLERIKYFLESGANFQLLLNNFLVDAKINLNHYNYSELMSLYASLNKLFVEVEGLLTNLNGGYAGESISYCEGSFSDDCIKLVLELLSNRADLIALLKLIEPRIDAYEFFSKFYL